MTQCPPATRRPLFLSRNFSALVAVVLLLLAVPSASARRPAMHRHPRLHALAHTFVNVALPGAGLLPDDAEDVPLEGLQYELKLAHAQTGEMIDVVYRIGDTYIPEALTQLDLFLRDSHNQEVNAYDPRTFDLLHTMLAKLGRSNGVVDILSGYRSQETNDMLRASGTTNAAEHSQHISKPRQSTSASWASRRFCYAMRLNRWVSAASATTPGANSSTSIPARFGSGPSPPTSPLASRTGNTPATHIAARPDRTNLPYRRPRVPDQIRQSHAAVSVPEQPHSPQAPRTRPSNSAIRSRCPTPY